MSATLVELETPCLIADRSRIEANAARMLERAERYGFRLRPHLKTTKSADIGRIAHGGDTGPITVSTLIEAEYFLDNGFTDITYAVCISPNKFAHAASLIERGADLKVLLASESIARELAAFAGSQGTRMQAMIEIDCGDHRTGIAPGNESLAAAAQVLGDADAIGFAGLLTHGGHSYAATSIDEIRTVAEEERSSLISAKQQLRDVGIDTPVLSSGSTPTAMLGENYDGLDELRPGVYLAGDLFQAQIGTCSLDDIAVSVLASVIDHDVERNRLVIDAGGLALSKDRSTEHSPIDYGYGLLVRADGSRFDTPMIVAGVSQEHGQVTSAEPLHFDELPIGSMVRVLPNHVCMTAASYDKYFVTQGTDTEINDEWEKVTGW